MVAVSKGFVDIVYALNQTPFLEINHRDNDGNTALMIAAQAGKIVEDGFNSSPETVFYIILIMDN